MGSSLIAVNGVEAWGFATELNGALRVRFALDDWQRMNAGPGQRVPVQRPGREDVWLFVTHVVEVPPIVCIVYDAGEARTDCGIVGRSQPQGRGHGVSVRDLPVMLKVPPIPEAENRGRTVARNRP